MIYLKMFSLINKIRFSWSRFTAKNRVLIKMYQTPKNSAVGDISRCQNRQDFARHRRPYALRFACGMILQIVAEKISNANNTIFKHPEIILNGGHYDA